MNEQPKAIPTNIISGFLGVGKTTAINALLANKPDGESWAVLVNEFGQVGIDQEMMPTEEGLFVKEMAGGCICCALGASLTPTLKALIEHANPDRLIIEPTGIGHPEGIIDTLMGPAFKDKLDLRATVCILDPRSLQLEEVVNNETFHDQLNLADVVMINKCDIAETDLIELAETSLSNMFPPKQHIARTTKGVIDPFLLDLVRNGQLKAQFPEAHHHDHGHEHHHHDHHPAQETTPEAVAEPNQPIRKTGNGSGLFSCGWIFHRDDCFDFWALEKILTELDDIERIKGVIRIGHAWVFFNRVKDEHDFDKVAYRRDSRIEIISSKELDWEQLEKAMLACQSQE
ncbi:CobW family GTP-binding protein [Marinomonas atlantica]|uniref:CobW family GTP-binding protein n=1 Tax=Marinomonas atlantica TaxID=1806668 RepID=UPI000834D81D|nr:GTP-binding protein [Marinomonas atlantica]